MNIREEMSAAPKVPLRYLVSFNPRPASNLRGDSVYLPMEAISEFGPVDTSRRRPFGELRQGYSYVENGDIALAKVTPCFENGKGLVARNLPGGHAFATTEVTVIRPSAKIDADYLGWVLQSSHFVKQGESHMTGSGGLRRVPESFIGSYSIPLPDRRTQRAIADYLDRETARIDTLIEEQQRLIEILRERRTAVVAHGTSQGTQVEFRRVIAALRQGWSPNCENLPADGVEEWGVLKVGCANTGRFDPAENKRLPGDVAPRPELAVRRGEIIMSRSNTKELVGTAAVVDDNYPRLLLSDLTYGISLTADADPAFVAYALASPGMRVQISAAAKGMSHSMQKISQRDIRELRVRLPVVAEQRRIAAYLDEQTAKIDTLITETERFIELARERRSALITAAVTGQIDVREMV